VASLDPQAAPLPGAAGAPKLALIGFMGAGKTTAARLLGRRSADVDHVIEQRTGRKPQEIFATDGEQVFRELEERTTRELLADRHIEVQKTR